MFYCTSKCIPYAVLMFTWSRIYFILPFISSYKTIIKTTRKPRLETNHYHILSREEQVALVRLLSGHNRLNNRLATKLRLIPSPCVPAAQRLSQQSTSCRDRCPSYNTLIDQWRLLWQTMIFSPQWELERTAWFTMHSGLSLRSANKEEEKNDIQRTRD